MRRIAVKFGGTSLADALQFQKVKRILDEDPARRYIVVSAPGKRYADDIKVTDLLIACWERAHDGHDFAAELNTIRDRFAGIVEGLGICFDLDKEIQKIAACLAAAPYRDYALSRGEYLNGKIMAAYLQLPFIDPAFYIHFDEFGALDEEKTNTDLAGALEPLDGAVIAGFYGSLPSGAIKTFSRGGSDVTGAIVARAVGAECYENWTDVSGMLAADPKIIPEARKVEFISYRELRILSYMGASVLHTDAVRPVRSDGIPINIRNTNCPEDPGTLIVPVLSESQPRHAVTGVAGRRGLCVVQVEKSMVSDGAGFTAVLLDVFKNHRVPFEQCLTGIDTISIVLRSDRFEPARDAILEDIRRQLSPDTLCVKDHLSMITVVGEYAPSQANVTVNILAAVAAAGIPISTINQGAGNLNLILGVAESDYEASVRAIYRTIKSL